VLTAVPKDGGVQRRGTMIVFAMLIAAHIVFCSAASAQERDRRYEFHIDERTLSAALDALARQANVLVLYPYELAGVTEPHSVSGKYTIREAYEVLLRGTDFSGGLTDSGVLTIARRTTDTQNEGEPMPNKKSRTASIFAFIGSALAAHQSQAQTVDTGDIALEEVIVTAQRRAERLQSVPVSVNVTTGDTLQERGIATLQDLSESMPNLKIATGPASDQLHIRGTGSGFNPGFEQSVATFVDGVYRNRSRSMRVAMLDIDRIEVLKGPQTTFFGANAIAGALSITTRKPTHAFEGNVLALYEPSAGEYNAEGAINTPINDSLALRFAGRWSGMDGYIKNDFNGNKGPHLKDAQGRASARWTPNDRTTIDARFDIARQRDTNTFEAEFLNCPPVDGFPPGANQCARNVALLGSIDSTLNLHSGARYSGFSNINMEEAAVIARIDLDAVSLVSTSAYFHQLVDQIQDLAPYPAPPTVGTGGYFPYHTLETFRQYSQEFRLESPGDRRLTYMAGIYYENGKLDNPLYSGFFFAPFGAFAAPYYNATSMIGGHTNVKVDSKTLSGFASATLGITDHWKLTASARYSRVTKDGDRTSEIGTNTQFVDSADFVPGPAPAQAILSAVTGITLSDYPVNSRTDQEFMPSANLRYIFSDDLMTYLSYAHGFKAGGFGSPGADVFGPETVDSYEAGLKSQWLNRRITANVALFRMDYSDLQESQQQVSASTLLSIVTNVGKSRSQGVEFSGGVLLSDGLNLHADVAWLDSYYISFPNATCTPMQAAVVTNCTRDLSGQRRAFAPKWSGSVGLDYKSRPFWQNTVLKLGALVSFTSKYYEQATISDLVEQKGYGKLDLRGALDFDDGRWEVAVIGKNVTDKITANYRNYAVAAPGSVVALPDRPRSVALQVSAKW